MKKHFLLLLLSLVVEVHSLIAQASEAEIIDRTETALNDAFNEGLFSGHLQINHNGKEIYYKKLGFSDWSMKTEFDRKTVFNIGSLNQIFTEEIIQQLIKEDKLRGEDELSKHLAIYPKEIGDLITVQQLYRMQAGLNNYTENPEFKAIKWNNFTLNDLVEIVKREQRIFEPDDGEEYSSSGYILLGAIIEKITKKTYEQNLNERIVQTLGLDPVYYSKADKLEQENRAKELYHTSENEKITIEHIINGTPAVGLHSNLNNLLKFIEAKRTRTLPSGKKYESELLGSSDEAWSSSVFFSMEYGYSFAIQCNLPNIGKTMGIQLKSIINKE